ncbi:NADP-dependent oxidoreductase [Sesbania bispinosa]|nr:NADP-dependent oxidoreductase [Sesbania bispinosa]
MAAALLHDHLSSIAAWIASSVLLHGRFSPPWPLLLHGGSLTPVARDVFFAAIGVGRTTAVGRGGRLAK